MAGLGDLTSMMNMMNNRRQSRLDNEYRDSVLAQRGEQLEYQQGQDKINNAARDRQLAGYEESIKNQSQAQANQNDAAAALQRTRDHSRIAQDILPVVGEGLSFNSNGGISISDEGMASVLQNNMTAALKVMRASSQFESLASSMGVPYDDITGLQPLSDGTFALIVKNGDTEGPLTVGGTSNNDDPITKLDQATVKRIFENGMGGVMNDGGFDSQASQIWATMGVDSARRAEIKGRREMESAVAGILQSDGAMLSQNGDTEGVDAIRRASLDINDMSYDDLAGIMADRGMSMEDIEAQFPRPTQQSSTSQSSENPRLPSAAESGEEAIASLEAMGLSFERSEDGAFGAMNIPENASPKLKSLLKGFEQRRSPSAVDVNDPDSMTDEADQYRSRMAMSSAQKVQEYAAGLPAEIARLEAEQKGTGHSARNNRAKLQNARRDFEILNPSAVTPDSKLGTEENPIDPPDITLTRENMIAKITEEGWTPTDNQRSQMSEFLQNAGVQSLQDLRKIPEREAVLAAAILATSDRTATVAQQQELLQKTFNLIERGAMDYSLGDQIDDVGNAGTLRQRINEFNAAETKEYNDINLAVGEELEALTMTAGAKGDDAVRWYDVEMTAPTRSIYRNFERTTGATKLAYGRAAAEAMGIMLKKYSSEKDPGLFSLENIKNIWRSDSPVDYTIDDISDRIVINPDGKTFGFIDPLDRAGIVEGEIPLAVVRTLFGSGYEEILKNKARQRPPVAM